MAMISRFEDIQAWQEARQLVKIVYKLTSTGALQKILVCAIKFSVHLFLP